MINSNGASNNFLDRESDPTAFATINLLSLVARDGPSDMAQILQDRNDGIYPARTKEELDMLHKSGLVTQVEIDDRLRYQATDLGRMTLLEEGVRDPFIVQQTIDAVWKRFERDPPELPPEKYGNEEFRFTWRSVAELINKILKDNSYITPRVLALGAPTIAYFGASSEGLVDSYLLDINEDIVHDLNNRSQGDARAVVYDARDSIPYAFKSKFDAVVADPPWHTEFYSLFADRGYDLLRPYGKLYMSTSGPATRPEAPSELNDMYMRLIGGGFHLTEVTPGFFSYQIPGYERGVFKEQRTTRDRVKYGQLIVAQATPIREDICSTWESIELAGQEKIYSIKTDDGKLNLGDIIHNSTGELLDGGESFSVSRFSEGAYSTAIRSQRRSEGVNFVSRNHIAFIVSNPGRLVRLSELYESTSNDAFISNVRREFEMTDEDASATAEEFYKILNALENDGAIK